MLPLLIEHAEQQNQGFTVTSFHGRIVPCHRSKLDRWILESDHFTVLMYNSMRSALLVAYGLKNEIYT